MAITSSAFKDLSDANSVGTRLGQSTTDLICFYGATTASARISIGGVSISSGVAASTLIFALQTYGLINVSTALAP